MRNRLLARRYANALMLNIDEQHLLSFRQDIKLLHQTFAENPDYAKSLNSQLFPQQERLDLALKIADKLKNHQLWHNFFEILIKKHRFNIIVEILLELEEAILIKDNCVKVQLTVARKLPEEIMQDISAVLRNIIMKDIELEVKTEAGIIGGFVAHTDSLLIDSSVRGSLTKLTKKYMRSV